MIFILLLNNILSGERTTTFNTSKVEIKSVEGIKKGKQPVKVTTKRERNQPRSLKKEKNQLRGLKKGKKLPRGLK